MPRGGLPVPRAAERRCPGPFREGAGMKYEGAAAPKSGRGVRVNFIEV